MDGRKLFVFGAFALGVCSGCVPNSSKTGGIETAAPTPTASNSPMNLWGEKKKEPKNLELSWAAMLASNAGGLADEPEKQIAAFDEARKAYHEILNYDPDCIEALRGLGRAYIGLRDYERASAAFKKAIEKQPTNASLYAEYSVVYSKRNMFPDAIRLVSKAVDIDPENLEFQRMLAVDCICNGEIDKGLAAMTRARGPAAAHYYVARVYERKGKTDLARAELAKALQANPNLQEARAMLDNMEHGQVTGLPNPSAPPTVWSDVKQAKFEQGESR